MKKKRELKDVKLIDTSPFYRAKFETQALKLVFQFRDSVKTSPRTIDLPKTLQGTRYLLNRFILVLTGQFAPEHLLTKPKLLAKWVKVNSISEYVEAEVEESACKKFLNIANIKGKSLVTDAKNPRSHA